MVRRKLKVIKIDGKKFKISSFKTKKKKKKPRKDKFLRNVQSLFRRPGRLPV